MRLRVIAAATLMAIGSVGVAVPALAQSDGEAGPSVTVPPVTLPPVTLPPVTLPPITVPPLPVPPLPTPPATPPAGVPSPPGLPAPSADTPAPSLPGGSPAVPSAGDLPSPPGVAGGDPAGALGALAASPGATGALAGPGVLTDLVAPGAERPSLAEIADLQSALDTALDTVTATVCAALTTVATTLEPVTGPVTDAIGDLPVPPVGTGLGGALGLRLDLQALSELPARTFLDLSAGLPGLLAVRLTLPGCTEDATAVTPPASPPRGTGSELIPPTGIAQRLQIPGTPTAVLRPAPALAAHPAFTG